MSEPVCKRCGQCCMMMLRGNPRNTIACSYLIIHDNGLTSCRVWDRRERLLKRGEYIKMRFNQNCVNRVQDKFDYDGCPYNTNKTLIKLEVKKR